MKVLHGRLAVVAAAAMSLVSSLLHAQVNVTTYHNDVARTGQNTQETILTPANVNATTFGKLFSVVVDGNVYAQPLYLSNVTIGGGTHNVVYVATEHDSLYAIDADKGTIYWRLSLIPAGGSTVSSVANLGCGDLVPEVGITGTPVIDPSSGTIYLVAKSKIDDTIVQYLHAIDVVTATEKFGAPIAIQAAVTGSASDADDGLVTFSAQFENQRAALLLDKDSQGTSHVVIGWSGHCDIAPWHGWVMSYNAATLAQDGVLNLSPNGYANAIWQSGSGPVADASGNIYFATGNGSWNGTTDFGDSIVKLGPPSGGTFPVIDYFTPYNQAALSSKDLDVSSGGLILLPVATNGKQQIVQQSKAGTIFNLDSSNLGKYCANQVPACTTSDPQISQEIVNATVGIWGAPAYWNGSVYWAGGNDNTGQTDHIKAFGVNPATGLLSTTPTSQTAQSFGFSAPVPVVSSNGKTNGILWGLDDSQLGACTIKTHCQALYAYDATNLANLLYSSQQAPNFRDVPAGGIKFATPTVANGKVYVGSQYRLAVYGLLTATPVFSPTPGSFSSAQSVTLTDATAGSTIYYTTNGTVPTTSSTVYTGPIAVSATTTISALAIATGYANSAVATATYTIGTTATPVNITLPSPTVVAIGNPGTAVPGGGLDGGGSAYDSSLLGGTLTWSGVNFALGAPNAADAISSSTIPIAANSYSTLYMLGTAVGGNQAAQPFVVTYTDGTTTSFTQSLSDWSTPQSFAGESVALAMADRVLKDGTLDLRTFNLYGYSFALNPAKTVQSFTLPANRNIKVLAIALQPAAAAAATATPVFSPAAGTFTSAQSVKITDATAGSTIHYTTNGTTPAITSPLYTGPIPVSATTTINAIAVATGHANSAVATATYTVQTPGFTLSAAANPLTLQQNAGGSDNISITPVNGFKGNVSLAVSGAPSGVSTAFAGDLLIVFPPLSTPIGSYPLTITGTSGSTQATTTVSLVITAGATFSLSPAVTGGTVPRGSGGSDVITVIPAHGFASAVSFAAANLPPGVTASFSPASSASSSTLTLAVSSTATPGTYAITIVATAPASNSSASFSETTTLTLVIS